MILFFDSYAIEIQISGSWIDFTPDVLPSPRPHWNVGIMNNSALSRIGDPENFSFSLNNGAGNSAGLAGYFTPGHANCMSGWRSGLPVHLYFVFEGLKRYKYYGHITPDGITVAPGVLGARSVDVVCHGFMAQAANHNLNLPEFVENKRIDEVVPLIIGNMPTPPLATEYHQGIDTFPTVFDTVRSMTTALAEFNKLAMSEYGYIYTKGDGSSGETLVVEARDTRNSIGANTEIPLDKLNSGFLLREDGGYLLREDGGKIVRHEAAAPSYSNIALSNMKTGYGKNLANQIKATLYPRRVDAAATTILFVTQSRIAVDPGETKTGIRGVYRDPNGAASYVSGRDMAIPEAGTDYTAYANSDGTGAPLISNLVLTYVYGTEAVEYTLQNIGGTRMWVWIQAKGRGIYIYDSISSVAEDETSELQYGVYPLSIDMKYQSDPTRGDVFANFTLLKNKDPRMKIDSYPILANRDGQSMYGFLCLEPGSRAHFSEPQSAVDDDYFICGYEAEIVAGKYVIWAPVLKSATDDSWYEGTGWVLGASQLEIDTTLAFG